MKYIVILILYLTSIYSAKSQSLLNTEFDWNKPTEIVISNTNGKKIYLKTEIDPVFKSISKVEFHTKLKEVISQVEYSSSANGIIKLYILFEEDNPISVDRIGTKGIKYSENLRITLAKYITEFGNYQLGSTNGIIQNSYGIIYLNIQDGQLAKTRNVNFDFK